MSEKFEYDNRRIQREFNEKLDNVYECIEKLELGRLRAEKTRQEPEAIAGLKDAVIAIFTGTLALILYILTFLSVRNMKKQKKVKISISVSHGPSYKKSSEIHCRNYRTNFCNYFLQQTSMTLTNTFRNNTTFFTLFKYLNYCFF